MDSFRYKIIREIQLKNNDFFVLIYGFIIIILHKAAKQFFDEQGLKKLTTVKSLQAEYALLLSEKKAMYADYQKAREDMRSLQTAKANVDRILGDNSLTAERETERDRL